MPYFAAVLARGSDGWSGEEIELKGVEDLDGVVDEMRTVADDADALLMFVEENDEWFAVVRLEGDDDPRVFVSDGRVVETSELGALLGEAAAVAALSAVDPAGAGDGEDDDAGDEDEDEDGTQVAGDPIGDVEIMSDLGTPAGRLLALCAEEGQLPADVITALCERAGCLDALDELRIA